MRESIAKLASYWEFDKKYKVILYVFKSLVLIGFTAYLTFVLTSYHDGKPILWRDLLIMAVSFLVWVIMEVSDIIRNKLFPLEILSHLRATYDLGDLSKKYHRKEKIDEYISCSISSLNANTCPISGATQENHLCQENVRDSLEEVVYNLINNTGTYLDCDCRDFTVGILINNIYDPSWEAGKPYVLPVSIVFRDNFQIGDNFPNDIVNFDSDNQIKYFLQSRIKQSIDQSRFLVEKQVFDGVELQYLFVPVPNVCETCPPDGTIVIITKQKNQIPIDAEKVLTINGQIVANWLSKFNDCVVQEKKITEYRDAHMSTQVVGNKVKDRR